jgi:hypothetical protein
MHTFELPSGVEAELREMTGAEEEILTNPRLIRSGDAINQVLANCIARLGDAKAPSLKDVLDLLSGDRLFLLVRLRQVSLGDEVALELACGNPSCRQANTVLVNLEELEVTKYAAEREFKVTLPVSQRVVAFGHLDGHMEKRLAALKEPSISSAMTMRIREIDGKAPSRKALSELTLKDRNALREAMREADAGIDTTVETECEACGAKLRARLEAEPAFLFPGVRF